MEKIVFIEKVNNGYVVRTKTISDEIMKDQEEAFLKFLQMSGMYEKYEEQKEEELRRFIRMFKPKTETIIENNYVFSTLKDAFDFISKFMLDELKEEYHV